MRVIVFFDLPTETARDRKEYTKFRRFLLSDGFVMMQKSVYSKIVLNGHAADILSQRVRNNRAPDGTIQILKITEAQYQSIEYVIGEARIDVVDTQARLVVL